VSRSTAPVAWVPAEGRSSRALNVCTVCVAWCARETQERNCLRDLIKETVDLWRSVFEGNHETSTWFRQEVEKKIEQFVTTEDQNILMLMLSTVCYCLLRLFLAAGSSLGDAEQNDAIKTHLHRAAANGQDPDKDSWSTRSIYASAKSKAEPSASARISPATARTAPASAA
jgi:hypothetical protein